MVWVLVFLVASLAAVYFNRTLVRSTLPQQTNSTTNSRKIRHVCRDRTIFITDASSGYAREAALLLSQQGFHVLAGVKTESQRRSFVYDVASRKGLEPVVVDISDPAQLADLLYRIRQVALDLQRPLYGVLINSLQELEYLETGLPTDGWGPQSSGGKGRGSSNKKKVAPPEPAAVLRASSLDVDSLETAYRRLLKGPARLIQAALQPDMWGGTGLGLGLGLGEEEEEKEREECEGLTGRVVLLSPTLSSDIPPAASAQISALHNWLLAGSGSGSGSEAEAGAGGRGVTVVQVLEQSSAEQRRRRFAGGGLSWALDLSASGMAGQEPGRCSASSSSIAGDGVGVGECGQATLKPLDSSFSPRANLLARALVSQRPQRVYFL